MSPNVTPWKWSSPQARYEARSILLSWPKMAETTLPLVFLPGASSRGEVWRPVIARLAKRREAHLLDYPGLGQTPAEPGLCTLSDLSRWLESKLPPQFDLAALSMGASLALRWALAWPERVRRLALVAPAGGVDARRFGGIDWRSTFEAARPNAPRFFLDDDTHFDAELGRIGVPTLLVLGADDLVAPVAAGEFLRARLPRALLEVVPRATHDIETEFPDLVASLIEAHLRARAPATAPR